MKQNNNKYEQQPIPHNDQSLNTQCNKQFDNNPKLEKQHPGNKIMKHILTHMVVYCLLLVTIKAATTMFMVAAFAQKPTIRTNRWLTDHQQTNKQETVTSSITHIMDKQRLARASSVPWHLSHQPTQPRAAIAAALSCLAQQPPGWPQRMRPVGLSRHYLNTLLLESTLLKNFALACVSRLCQPAFV